MANQLEAWKQTIENLQKNGRLPHGSNLLTKLNKKEATSKEWSKAFSILVPEYLIFQNTKITSMKRNNESPYFELVKSVNRYLTTLRHPDCQIFSHQSDFISSVIPEFFFILFSKIVEETGLPYFINSQKDIIIDCIFDPLDGGRLVFKKKRVDVAILLPVELNFKGTKEEFFIPIVAIEVKTNLDKTMISGIEHSVESLKRTFPKCLYFAVTEFSDFAIEKQNYSMTYIDEIYILRKQKRAEMRRTKIPQDISIDLIDEIGRQIEKSLVLTSTGITPLQERTAKGVLIDRRGMNG